MGMFLHFSLLISRPLPSLCYFKNLFCVSLIILYTLFNEQTQQRIDGDAENVKALEDMYLSFLPGSSANAVDAMMVRTQFLQAIADNQCAVIEKQFPIKNYSADIPRYKFAPPALYPKTPEALADHVLTNLISQGFAARASTFTIYR